MSHLKAAMWLSIAPSTLYRLVREGKVRAFKPGGKLLYCEEHLWAYVLGFSKRLSASQRAQIKELIKNTQNAHAQIPFDGVLGDPDSSLDRSAG